MDNSLLEDTPLPRFQAIRPEHVEPAIEHLLAEGREAVEQRLAATDHYTWDNLAGPLEAANERLDRAWSPVRHLNSVANSEALREVHDRCLGRITEYYSELGQNSRLYQAYEAIARDPGFQELDRARQRAVELALRDFRLAGVALAQADKERFRRNSLRLAQLSSMFENNLLDATHAWQRQVTDPDELAGLPESDREVAAQTARREGQEGWLLTLDTPCYLAVMTHAERRELREEIYRAYVTRASELGPNAGQWDNRPVMEEILALRHEQARLLGFANYAELSLQPKMAPGTDEVITFLEDLGRRARPRAEAELSELRALAAETDGLEDLQAWDLAFYAERLRQHQLKFSQEDLRPYLDAERVVNGLFEIAGRLFGVQLEPVSDVDTWHPDVRFYAIRDAGGTALGHLYVDLYARPQKRGGAWMDECRVRHRRGDELQLPVAYLTCNFTPPVAGRPSLLTHDEVETLFHEFGHALHHLLTRVDVPSVAGINGVAWDAVELPSQFLENWCWEREALDCFAQHHDSGEPLPEDLYQRLRASRVFQSGMQTVRQLEFALFDLRLHRDYDPDAGPRVDETLEAVRDQVSVLRPPAFNRFANSFAHVFAGGYAAGYYSYKWAEVLAADAFARFAEEGIFNPRTGTEFRERILARGGSEDAMTLFRAFRGRQPSIEPLLQSLGLANAG